MTRRLLAALGLVLCSVHAAAMTGTVTHVTDGDTLWVRVDRARPVPVRLYGIDAPERCQDGGPEATEALSRRVLRRQVEVETRAEDTYGRLVGVVRLDGEDLGEWLVSQGLAWSPGFRQAKGPYADEERRARARRRGVFAQQHAVEPKVFRKEHGPCPRAPRRATTER